MCLAGILGWVLLSSHLRVLVSFTPYLFAPLSEGLSKWHCAGWRRSTAKRLQLVPHHTQLPAAPRQARARSGALGLHFFVIKHFMLPAQRRGLSVWLSIHLISLTWLAAVCVRIHSVSGDVSKSLLLRCLLQLLLPLNARHSKRHPMWGSGRFKLGIRKRNTY